jgi:lipoprotein-anchoring transpeptidase ErfK/SrfK
MNPVFEPVKKTETSLVSRKKVKQNLFFQPKLTVGPTDDVYEREADAVADRVMRMGNERVQMKTVPVDIQKKCAHCEEEEKLQRKETDTGEVQSEAPSAVQNVLNSSGGSLDDGTRSFMESRFGYDFSGVKIHTDTVAAKSAQSINALAYTSGNNIVFNAGRYSPDTTDGKRLLAHELTHVVQQKHATVQRQPDDTNDLEAEPEDAGLAEMMSEEDDNVRDGYGPVTATMPVPDSLPHEETDSAGNGTIQAKSIHVRRQRSPRTDVPRGRSGRHITDIVINLTRQRLTITWSDGATESERISTGKGCPNTSGNPCARSSSDYCTTTGNFHPEALGGAGYVNSFGDAMPFAMFFDAGRGIAIHQGRGLGAPRSHGCVRTTRAMARKIHNNVIRSTDISVTGRAPTTAWTTRNMRTWSGCPSPPARRRRRRS